MKFIANTDLFSRMWMALILGYVLIRIATWNVNSIRQRFQNVIDFLKDEMIDVLLLQELKCEDHVFPCMEFESLGYNCAVHGQKSYNGVAILSKYRIEDVIKYIPGNEGDVQARYIEVVLSLAGGSALRVASVYVPNGKSVDDKAFQYKLEYLDKLYDYMKDISLGSEEFLIAGDFNVAPFIEDVYSHEELDGSVGFHNEERIRVRKILNLGYLDTFRVMNPNIFQFSWWDYRGGAVRYNRGMRIDYALISSSLGNKLKNCFIANELRVQKHASDHVPVVCELNVD